MKCSSPAKAQAVFSSALRKIKPTPKETEQDFAEAEKLMAKLRKALPNEAEVALAGSLSKGTDLKGKNEFDIFLLFPRSTPHEKMTSMGISCAKKAFRGMKTASRFAEHPYLQVFSGNYHADIVPAYRIHSIHERGSSVDRSILHTSYINGKMDSKAKDDVRLLKQFTKNFGIYGAELRVEGFSGYLCELLIAHYGSLLRLMEEASDWKEPVIDAEGHHKEGHRKMFPNAALVVIDPVDPKRNVAAVVAQTSLSRFIFECRRFLASPSEKFFFSQKTMRTMGEISSMLKKRGTKCLMVAFPAPQVVPDVLWPQLKKTTQALARYLSSSDFSVFGYYHWSDGVECAIFLEIDRWELPGIKKAIGPSVSFASDVDAFAKKHKRAFNLHLEHDRIVAVERRGTTTCRRALMLACKSKGSGIPKGLQKSLSRASILEWRGMLKGKYREMLSDYLFAKIA